MPNTVVAIWLPVARSSADFRSWVSSDHGSEYPPTPKRDINAVLAAHDRELLAIPGVVGVYVGTLEGRRTSCLRVMLARKNPESERKIPRVIEGYPVVTEVTGEIRALGTP